MRRLTGGSASAWRTKRSPSPPAKSGAISLVRCAKAGRSGESPLSSLGSAPPDARREHPSARGANDSPRAISQGEPSAAVAGRGGGRGGLYVVVDSGDERPGDPCRLHAQRGDVAARREARRERDSARQLHFEHEPNRVERPIPTVDIAHLRLER